ncbi:sporulation integral membrane protein YtvI [Thalassobacillus pellis]|uniref:sporulation integral membrane protein YtvI n=1 Tax=Thalassobacillus pellis TaxID=748008 RepID=UPI00195F48EA|nr:sporulation integral membrane protein YtvI [Thalassobacillus pellis]MBM7554986.1 sporulation integral membrane protein YtvI [Thalassobacillus pellis]
MDMVMINRIFRFLIVVSVTSMFFLASYQIAQYTYPFIFALLIAYMINPLVDLLERQLRFPRGMAVFTVLLSILAVLFAIITLLIVEIADGTSYLAEEVPQHFKTLISYLQAVIATTVIPIYQKLVSFMNTLDPAQQQTIMTNIQNIGENIAQEGALLLQNILQKIPVILKELPSYITVLVFSLLGTFFISKDWYRLTGLIKKTFPQRVIISFRNVLKGLKKAMVGFLKAQLTLISITAVIVLIGLLILRVDYAVTIAVITGAVDLLPYLGTGLIFVPWIIYMFFTGNYFLTIGLAILYIIVIIQRQLMEPKVLSNNIGLDPLATLVSLFVGYQLFGFLGLIAGPVVLVILSTLFKAGVFHEIWRYIISK